MTDLEFLRLLKAHRHTIYHVSNKYCKDVTVERDILIQDIIIELWKSLGNFKKGCTFNTWIYTIARNVSISALRAAQIKKKNSIKTEGLGDYAEYLQYEDCNEELVKQLHEAMRYNTVLDSIEEPYRTIFLMHLEGVNYKEMEQQTGVTENALRVKICHIKKQLRLRYG